MKINHFVKINNSFSYNAYIDVSNQTFHKDIIVYNIDEQFH